MRLFRWTLLLPILLASAALAHPVRMASAVMSVEADGAFTLTLTHDVLAYVLDQTPQQATAEAMDALLARSDPDLAAALESTRTRLAGAILIRAHDAAVRPGESTYPRAAEVRGFVGFHQDQPLPVVLDAVVKGVLPQAARTMAVQFPPSLGPVVLSVNRPAGDAPVVLALDAAQSSGPIRLKLQGPSGATPPRDPPPQHSPPPTKRRPRPSPASSGSVLSTFSPRDSTTSSLSWACFSCRPSSPRCCGR